MKGTLANWYVSNETHQLCVGVAHAHTTAEKVFQSLWISRQAQMRQCRTIRILLHVAGHNRVDSGFWPLLTDRIGTQKPQCSKSVSTKLPAAVATVGATAGTASAARHAGMLHIRCQGDFSQSPRLLGCWQPCSSPQVSLIGLKTYCGLFGLETPYHCANSDDIADPICAGDFTTVTPAASSALILSCAVPLPPAMIAPAWPMRRPGGAVRPAEQLPRVHAWPDATTC